MMMRAIECAEFGEPEGLRVVEREVPEVSGTQVLVRVHASGLNFADLLMVQGNDDPQASALEVDEAVKILAAGPLEEEQDLGEGLGAVREPLLRSVLSVQGGLYVLEEVNHRDDPRHLRQGPDSAL